MRRFTPSCGQQQRTEQKGSGGRQASAGPLRAHALHPTAQAPRELVPYRGQQQRCPLPCPAPQMRGRRRALPAVSPPPCSHPHLEGRVAQQVKAGAREQHVDPIVPRQQRRQPRGKPHATGRRPLLLLLPLLCLLPLLPRPAFCAGLCAALTLAALRRRCRSRLERSCQRRRLGTTTSCPGRRKRLRPRGQRALHGERPASCPL